MQTKRCTRCGRTRPVSAFYPDKRYRDGFNSWCKRCKLAVSKRNRAAVRRERHIACVAATERRARALAAKVPADFGHWLAGFIDGEGCFAIHRLSRAGYVTYGCVFRVSVRSDDREVLEVARRTTAIGRIYSTTPRQLEGGTSPSVAWVVQSKADCLALVALLDARPLRAKKARDYAIWREAVLLWHASYGKRASGGGPSDWTPMVRLREALSAARAYRES